MKKSNVFSSKLNSSKDVFNGLSAFTVVAVGIFAILIILGTLTPSFENNKLVCELAKTLDGKHPYSYCFSLNQFDYYTLVFPFIAAILQFFFLHQKENCYTLLSFGKKRRAIYTNRLLPPLVSMLAIMLVVKAIALIINVNYIGFTPDLLGIWFIHILLFSQMIMFIYAITVFCCHMCGRTIEAIAASIYMPDAVYDNAQQIWVYQREASDIVYNLYYDEEGNSHKKYQKLRPFGMQYADFTTVKEYYYRSQLCNYTYNLIFDDKFNNDAINAKIAGIEDVFDKNAMKAARTLWKSLKIFDRWSNKYLANSFETKIRSIGSVNSNYAINHITNCDNFHRHRDAMAECEHNRWNVQQLLMGFRACTSEESDMVKKDPAYKGVLKKGREKAHVDIRPFEMLDKSTKDVDYIFNNAIPEILMLIEKSYEKRENSQK